MKTLKGKLKKLKEIKVKRLQQRYNTEVQIEQEDLRLLLANILT